jgi:hypothetical protein
LATRRDVIYPAALFPIGTLLFAVAIWRSRALPRAAAVGFVLANVLIAVPALLHSVRLAGGILGLACRRLDRRRRLAAHLNDTTGTTLTPCQTRLTHHSDWSLCAPRVVDVPAGRQTTTALRSPST